MKKGPVETIKSGSITISIYHNRTAGTFEAKWYEEGRRRKKRGQDLGKLKEEARTIAKRLSRGGIDLSNLSHDEANLCREVLRRGITLRDLDRLVGMPDPTTLRDAVDQFLEAKRANIGRSERHWRTLSGHLNRLVADLGENTPVGNITVQVLDKWLLKAKTTRSRKNWRSCLTNFFRWAKRKGMLPPDRETAAELTDQPKVVLGEVTIWTPDELKQILEVVPWDYVPWVAISAFAGVRTAELFPEQRHGSTKDPIRWENVWIDRDDPYIEVPASSSKTNDRRLIPICDTLEAWLRPFQRKSGPVCPAKSPSRRNHSEQTIVEGIAAVMDMKWKRNALRHSFGSYRTAETKNIGQVSLEMGNSPATVKRHYLEAVTTKEAEAWFAVTPDKCDRSLRVAS